VGLVSRQAQERGVRFVVSGVPAGRVIADATRLKQVLTNLLSNAVKYNREGGEVRVSFAGLDDTASREPMLAIKVCDTGMGMSEQQLRQLFQPFNRLGRERGPIEGTGIGLVICKLLMEHMGGRLEASSTEGVGSCFVIRLPLAPAGGTRPAELDELESAPARYHARTVHYIEDNETNVEVMRGMLIQRPQVDLTVSRNGLDGLADVRARRPDLVLLDMHLPDMDGIELLRHLRSDPSTAEIPVVVVSADALPAQIEAAFDAGATRYLTKPVSVNTVLSVVDELLDAQASRFG
jgi:CheY-like chemotaxis protein/anti-sigma regulatory factor (Ser/Thr protein kinase)